MTDHRIRIAINAEGILCGICDQPVKWVRPCDDTCRCDSFVGGWQHVLSEAEERAASMARHPSRQR